MEPEMKQEVSLPPEMAKRFAEAKTPAERADILREFANTIGAEKAQEDHAAVMSEDQFRTLIQKMGEMSADTAKAAIREITGDLKRDYHFGDDKAKEIAERSFDRAEQKLMNKRQDWQVAANVFRGMWLARQGKPDQYKRAIEEEADYFKRTYGRETRAMTLGSDSSGGYLAPEEFSNLLYENIQRSSIVRQFATMIPMNGNEVIHFPKMTASLSAAQVTEGSVGTNSQPTFDTITLNTKKIMTKTRPISIEMIEKANPAIIPLLLQFATIEIMKQEDALVFGTSGNGIRASSTNEVVSGSAGTGYSSISFDDMADLEGALDPQYTPDQDIQGSGIVSGIAQYWIPHKLKMNLIKIKDGQGRYLDEARELRNSRQIFGYNARRVLSLPDGTSLAANDKVALFGDLSYVWCGVEPGYRITVLDQATIDDNGSDVKLGDTAQAAIRVIEFFDSVVVDNAAFSQLKLAA